MGKVKSAKAAEKKRQRLLAAQAAKRVKESIKAAYEVENPLDGLEPFLAFDIAPSDVGDEKKALATTDGASGGLPSPSSAADVPSKVDGVKEKNSDENAKPKNKIPVKVSFQSSPLPVDLHDACLDLFKANMSDMYQASSWGLDLDEKSSELRHETARFLIVEAAADADGADANTNDDGDTKRDVLAFVHFRFEPNDDEKPTEEVLYVYEIQVSDRAQRSGLGKRLMNIMELVANKNGMQKVMLTVFKMNGGAMKFYREKMKYAIDESSPSNFDGEVADYEILSKVVGKRKE